MVKIKKSSSKFLFFLCIVAFWVLFALNKDNADYGNYQNAYYSYMAGAKNTYFEIGFYSLMKIFCIFKAPYPVFLIFCATLTLFIFFKAIKSLTNNKLFVCLLYFIYPFAFDIVQYRNFLGFSFVLYGLHYLLKKDNTFKNAIKYLICVLIGSLFHKSMIIYVIFLLLIFRNKKTLYSMCFAASFLLTFLILQKGILHNILNLLGLGAYNRYEYDGNVSTFIQYCILYIGLILISTFKYVVIDRINIYDKKMQITTKQTLLFRTLIISMLLLPFILLNGTSARFIRNIFIIFYCFISNTCFELKRFKKQVINHNKNFIEVSCISNNKKTISNKNYGFVNKKMYLYKKQWYTLLRFGLILIVLFVFYSQLSQGLYYEIVLLPVLTCNFLW